MKLTRSYPKSLGQSIRQSLLAILVINTCLNNIQPTSASKEEVDEQALSAMKSDNGRSRVDMNSLPNTIDGIGGWGASPCFYPCFHNNYYQSAGEDDTDMGKRNFNPWGGKRSPSPISEYFRQISELVKKGGFNPWGGKRDTNSDSSSRSSKDEYPSARRLPFNPWGGR